MASTVVYEDVYEDDEPYNYGYNNEAQADQPHQFSHNTDEHMATMASYFRELYTALVKRDLPRVRLLYMSRFNELSERFQKVNLDWLHPDELTNVDFGADPEDELAPVVRRLYGELYYRQKLTQKDIEMEIRDQSFNNYCGLLKELLTRQEPVDIGLPPEWQWDMIDEMIYQYGDMWRQPLQDLETDTWATGSMLNLLIAVEEKSQIRLLFEIYAKGQDPLKDSRVEALARHPMYQMLGYFALIGLLRVHYMIGNYSEALEVLNHVDLGKKHLFTSGGVPACQVATYYHAGICYMMTRRMDQALETFQLVLRYAERSGALAGTTNPPGAPEQQNNQQQTAQAPQAFQQATTYQQSLIPKTVEKINNLIFLCILVHPTQILEETTHARLNDKFQKQLKDWNQKWTAQEKLKFVEDQFKKSVPKFVFARQQDRSRNRDNAIEPQARLFLQEYREHLLLGNIQEYLRLYRSMPLSRLAMLLEADEAKLLKQHSGSSNLRSEMHGAAGTGAIIDPNQDPNAPLPSMPNALSGTTSDDDNFTSLKSVEEKERRLMQLLMTYKHKFTKWEKLRNATAGTLNLRPNANDAEKSNTGDIIDVVKRMSVTSATRMQPPALVSDDARPEVDFYIDGNMIHIADTKISQQYGEYMIRNIQRLNEFTDSLRAMKVEAIAGATVSAGYAGGGDRRGGRGGGRGRGGGNYNRGDRGDRGNDYNNNQQDGGGGGGGYDNHRGGDNRQQRGNYGNRRQYNNNNNSYQGGRDRNQNSYSNQ